MMKQECKWMKVLLRSFSYVLVAAVASAVTLLLWGQQPSKLTELEKIIDRQFVGQYDAAYVQDAAADAMVAALGDRWSFYMTEEEYDALMSDMRNSFVGIGVTVTPCEDGTGEEIISVSEGGPAHEVGLLTGDVIIKVDGASVAGLNTTEAKNLIVGEEGTQVTVTVRRGQQELDFVITRKTVKLTVAKGRLLPGNTTSLYSLDSDLYELTPLIGDLHSHSIRSDGRQDPTALAGYMRERGYDFFAMTDHHRYYPSEEVLDALSGLNSGIVPILGEEVHVPNNPLHIVHLGGTASVNEQYVKRREEHDAEILEYEARVPDEIPEMYKAHYARAMWASEHIRAVGGLVVIPHPFWRPKGSKRHNVSTEYAKIMLRSGLFDAYELIGAMSQQENNASVALWTELRCEGVNIPVVGSSDVHGV